MRNSVRCASQCRDGKNPMTPPSPTRNSPRAAASRCRGLALITVLWLISLLTLLATTVLAITRNHLQTAARAAQIITSEAISDSAIRLALLRIATPLDPNQPLGFSARWRMKLFDEDVAIYVEREAGRVDLNATDAALLAAVFTAGGVDAEIAHAFASRIVDWRDADSIPEAGGAELEDYKRAGLQYGPRNGPFQAVGELRQVLGLADISPELLDAFTVYSTRSPTISPDFAHPLVLRALRHIANRSPGESGAPGMALTGPTPTRQQLIGQVTRVRACLLGSPLSLCRVAVVRLTGNSLKPFLIYTWFTASDAAQPLLINVPLPL